MKMTSDDYEKLRKKIFESDIPSDEDIKFDDFTIWKLFWTYTYKRDDLEFREIQTKYNDDHITTAFRKAFKELADSRMKKFNVSLTYKELHIIIDSLNDVNILTSGNFSSKDKHIFRKNLIQKLRGL